MPYVRRRTTRRKGPLRRRTFRKRSRKMVGRIPRPPRRTIAPSYKLRRKWANPLDKKQLVKFKYADAGFPLSLTALGAYYASHLFRGNSVYDPDQSGVGVQPYGYDEYCALFGGRYKVYSSKIKVSFLCEETTRPIMIGLYASRSEYSYKDSSDLKVARGTRYRYIDSNNHNRRNDIYAYSTTKQQLPTIGDDGTYSQVSGNPTNTWIWCVFANSESLQEEIDLRFDVEITYYCMMSKLENLNES